MLRFLSLASLLLSSTQVSAEQCPLCVGGDEPNLSKTIGGASDGLSCSSLVSDVDIDLDGCMDLQILGYRWCDCPDYPEDYFCPMCKGAFVDIPNRFKEIPGTGKTCEEKLFVKASSVDSCDDAMKPGYACGCPEAEEPHCTICGSDVEEDLKITNPNALLTINQVGSYTCQELVNQAMLGTLTVDQCGLVQAEAFDTCGCGGSNPEGVSDETSEETNATTDVPVETDSSATNKDDSAACDTRGFTMVVALLMANMMFMNL